MNEKEFSAMSSYKQDDFLKLATKLMGIRYWAIRLAIASVCVVAAGMAGCPPYTAWQKGMLGTAALNYAEQQRQIIIKQALAEEQAATHRANAIEILGEKAKQYPEYRKQEFIGAFAEALQAGTIDQIIYVPTEAQIPLMEAGKRP